MPLAWSIQTEWCNHTRERLYVRRKKRSTWDKLRGVENLRRLGTAFQDVSLFFAAATSTCRIRRNLCLYSAIRGDSSTRLYFPQVESALAACSSKLSR